MTTPPDDTTTDTSAIIAALRAERDAALSEKAALAEELAARDAALASRDNRYREHAAHQAATIEVLKAMSASPGDPQPVFDLICRRARALFDGPSAGLFEYDGELVHLRAESGTSFTDAAALAAYNAGFPMVPARGSLTCRAILDGEIVHIRDLAAEPGISQAALDIGHRTQVSIPLMRGGRAVGAISAGSIQIDGISGSQVTLLKTFAEQAVIAISSAETYRALQTRTSDLQESLEYQTATSDVLKVISRSTFDLQPVLDTVAETAARLCDADQAAIFRREGGLIRFVTNCGFPSEYEAHLKGLGTYAFDPYPQNVTTRAIREGRTVHINDVALIPGYAEQAITLGKQRTSLGVPLLREGEAIGVIVLARQRVEPFTDRQIELVSTFADQAVIAIENTRLITEQREALEQQTATTEVLQVINASPGNLVPVFDALLEKALRLCESSFGILCTFDGEFYHVVAMRDVAPGYADLTRSPVRAVPGMSAYRSCDSARTLFMSRTSQRMRGTTLQARFVVIWPIKAERVL